MASFCLEGLWTRVRSEFSSIEDDFKAAFLCGQHMWESFYPFKRLEEGDSLKPTDSDLYCLCTAGTHAHAHTHPDTQILHTCCIYYQDLGWKLRLHAIWIGSFVCFCMGGVYVGHFASEACAFACRPGEGTWALIILAVSSPHHVVKSAEPECDELFTSAVFHPPC